MGDMSVGGASSAAASTSTSASLSESSDSARASVAAGNTGTSGSSGTPGTSGTGDTPDASPLSNITSNTTPPAADASATASLLAQASVPGDIVVTAPTTTPPPSVADQVRALSSYSLTDWSVTPQDQTQIVNLLGSDPQLNATLRDLGADPNLFGTSSLTAVVKRVDEPALRRDLVDVLARGSDAANADVVRGELDKIDTDVVSGFGGVGGVTVNTNLWQARFNLERLGVPASGPAFDRAGYGDLVSANPSAPFTGTGASGVDPTARSVPLGDQWSMLTGDSAVTQRYNNPVGDLNAYLRNLPPGDRVRQAELFLSQPIASPMSDVWGASPPTRAQVIEAAAARYNLDPATLGSFLLAEQRDQSQREDAKDYAAVVNANHNGSVGLGQVVISTARNNNLFADSISPNTMRQAGNPAVARMLSDDAISIFAAARYVRQVADTGSATPLATLDQRMRDAEIARYRTQEVDPLALSQAQKDVMVQTYAATLPTGGQVRGLLPGFDPARYAGNSAAWPRDNVVALGSEYTSRAWDGRWSLGWGNFVAEARQDVQASGVFR